MSIKKIQRALVSVSDKSGLEKMAAFFKANGILVISTGKTGEHLRNLGLLVTDIAVVGQCEEMLDGRVKTLNPRIHAGILFDRQKPEHRETLKNLDIAPIDLVVTNLYPFSDVAKKADATMAELIENIDIGGPTLLRAAAKNHPHVVVLCDPNHYDDFIDHYQEHQGTTERFREQCAARAFSKTCAYDAAIAKVFNEKFDEANDSLNLFLAKKKTLRYGENPHQRAQIFHLSDDSSDALSLPSTKSMCGKDLSYNNLLDAHAAIWALRCLNDGNHNQSTKAVIIKHGVPCGAAFGDNLKFAVEKAIASDEKSAFGGILAMSASCDEEVLHALKDRFFEIIIAPSFSDGALKELKKRKNLRVLAPKNLMTAQLPNMNYRSIFGGILCQDQDDATIDAQTFTTITRIKPSPQDLAAMDFAFRVVKATPSNAITVANHDHLLGVGAGQPNRIQSVELAITGALSRGFEFRNACMASDAFFPFSDCLELAHAHGIRLIIQPGGSIRDQEIIEAADGLGLCMVLTHKRHFRH